MLLTCPASTNPSETYTLISNLPPVYCRRNDNVVFSRMLRVFICLVVWVGSCVLSFSQSVSEVRVRVLDYRTGHPKKGWKVGLLVGNNWQVGRSGKDGVALFSIGEILPKTLMIDGLMPRQARGGNGLAREAVVQIDIFAEE